MAEAALADADLLSRNGLTIRWNFPIASPGIAADPAAASTRRLRQKDASEHHCDIHFPSAAYMVIYAFGAPRRWRGK